VDMHSSDLVEINDVTRVLIAYTCQQGVYPRGHVLTLRLPLIQYNTQNAVRIGLDYSTHERCAFIRVGGGVFAIV
jgi:hypothetical protein